MFSPDMYGLLYQARKRFPSTIYAYHQGQYSLRESSLFHHVLSNCQRIVIPQSRSTNARLTPVSRVIYAAVCT